MGQAESSTENLQKLHEQGQQQQLIPGLPDEIAIECLVRVPYKFHCNMKSVCRSWRTLVSHGSFYEERRRSGAAEHMVCLIQPLPPQSPSLTECSDSDGSDSYVCKTSEKEGEAADEKSSGLPLVQHGLSIYNATHQSWNRLMRSGGAHVRVPMFCQCVALPGKLLLLGGWDPNTLEPVPDVYVLDLIGGARWRRAAPMSVARSFFACGVVGQSTVYVAGGHDNQKNALRSAEVYDANADEWRMLPAMAEERDECQGLSWEGDSRFWVVSGYSTENQGQFRSDAECFDPITGTWSRIEGVWPYPRVSPRGLTTTITVGDTFNSSSHENQCQYQWWWFLGSRQLQGENGEGKESHDSSQFLRKVVNPVKLPSGISGTSVSVTALGLPKDHCFPNNRNQRLQRIFVMGSNGSGRGTSSSTSTCGDSECEGEGAFIVERESNSKAGSPSKWSHVHTPPGFSGFSYWASCILI